MKHEDIFAGPALGRWGKSLPYAAGAAGGGEWLYQSHFRQSLCGIPAMAGTMHSSCPAEGACRRLEGSGWTYWLFADHRPVGMGRIHHFLTDKLLEEGGSVGYAVRPGERGRGYGMLLLFLLLRECGRLGMEKVLLTIHKGDPPFAESGSGESRHAGTGKRQAVLYLDRLSERRG